MAISMLSQRKNKLDDLSLVLGGGGVGAGEDSFIKQLGCLLHLLLVKNLELLSLSLGCSA